MPVSASNPDRENLELLLRRIIREEIGLVPVAPAAKWRGTLVVGLSDDPDQVAEGSGVGFRHEPRSPPKIWRAVWDEFRNWLVANAA